MAAGLLLGLAEALTVHQFGSTWKDVVAFGLLFAILVLRPTGLFAGMRARDV